MLLNRYIAFIGSSIRNSQAEPEIHNEVINAFEFSRGVRVKSVVVRAYNLSDLRYTHTYTAQYIVYIIYIY